MSQIANRDHAAQRTISVAMPSPFGAHPLFFFDHAELETIARENADSYRRATPFPHVVLDDFLPEDVVESCIREFPTPDDIPWTLYTDAGNTRKLAVQDESLMGPLTRQLVSQLNASAFVRFLEALTGITGLVADPHLLGGGLHQIERGGFLNGHADFNRHPTLSLDRRLNLLLYLNPEWSESYGGDLQLWNADMSRCERRIFPIANRCVIFSTTDKSFHGHPDPLRTPDGITRRSLALYYYSAGRPEEEQSPDHSTLYRGTAAPVTAARSGRDIVRRLTPPIVLDAASKLKQRLRARG
jgi:hypothetical protein